ncbi:MAG TPA: hypothetical protein VHE35_17165 [Kofleriaceae bacterium]|nr:hypothetical protein [Kofleriaceae bacterium]
MNQRVLPSFLSLSIASALALGLAACVDEPLLGAGHDELTAEGDGIRGDTIDAQAMRHLYYDINPTPHAEKAYQSGDAAPAVSAEGTIVDGSGTVVVLVTTIYNRPPFGRPGRVSVTDDSGATLATASIATPGRFELRDLEPGTAVFIRPETIGTMAKILTPEQIALAGR